MNVYHSPDRGILRSSNQSLGVSQIRVPIFTTGWHLSNKYTHNLEDLGEPHLSENKVPQNHVVQKCVEARCCSKG